MNSLSTMFTASSLITGTAYTNLRIVVTVLSVSSFSLFATESALPQNQTEFFDSVANYSIKTPYANTTTIDLNEYLSANTSEVTFSLTSCDTNHDDYYDSITVANDNLVLIVNSKGHVHGRNTQQNTVCTIKAVARTEEQEQEFTFQIVSSRSPRNLQQGSLSVTANRGDELDVRLQLLGSTYAELASKKSTSSTWTSYVVSGLNGESAELTISGLELTTSYQIGAALITHQRFDLLRNGRTFTPGHLVATTTPASKWNKNLSGNGRGKSQRVDVMTSELIPDLNINDVTVAEAAGAMAQFTVTMSEASTQAVTVDYVTANGTALAGSDYTTTSGTLTIPVNTLTGTISVPVLNDAVAEPDETFTVTLSNPSNATVADDVGIGTITDDEIPIAPTSTHLLVLAKRAIDKVIVAGDTVEYEILLTNLTENELTALEVIDNLPFGFHFLPDSASIRLTGNDDIFKRPQMLQATVSDPVEFAPPFDVPAGGTVAIRYMTRTGMSVTPGVHINTATPFQNGKVAGNSASATVEVVADPIFEQTTIIGKVFIDKNEDGWQDLDEPGIPGVRLATVDGLLVETDAQGRYHLAAVDVNRFDRGTNFIIKLDVQTLPEGMEVISENPRVLRITQGLMSRINFAVKLPEKLIDEPRERVSLLRTVTSVHAGRIEPVRFESGKSQIPESYLDQLRQLLNEYRNKDSLRVRFVGHTDDEPLSPRAQAIYGDNQGLSDARATEVAQFVMEQLYLAPEMVETVGQADRQPIASNLNREGMALNRRVEIELIYEETFTEEKELVETQTSAMENYEVNYVTESARLEPVRFSTADATLTEDQIRKLDFNLESLMDYEILSVTLAGHTDTDPLTGDAKLADNNELSQLRAESVARHLLKQLNLDAEQLDIRALGASEPIADNDTPYGRALNRRVDIEIAYRRVNEIVEEQIITFTPVQILPTTQIDNAGHIWLTEDILTQRAQLAIMALNPVVVDEFGKMIEPVLFAAYGNYGAFADIYQLDVFRANDTDLIHPLAELETREFTYPYAFRFLDDKLRFEPGEKLAYVLRAVDSEGREDITHIQILNVVSDKQRNIAARNSNSVWGQSSLASQSIVIDGRRVRIHGNEFTPGDVVRVANTDVPVDATGRFITELHLPPGIAEIEVSGTRAGQSWSETLHPTVDENYTFIVGLANITVGQQDLANSFEPISENDNYDDSVFVDGRFAFYLKAKVKGKYLVTAQLDTTEDDLDNLSDNLKRKDPRRVFRQLDPDRYYPVYGDDSTTTSDVDTQGALYLRVDWEKNQVLWGNYDTGLTDTEYMQYNRSLYGARVLLKSKDVTRFEDSKHSLNTFISESQTATARITFKATGGSLYYLKHTDIVQGSEKVWVEIRQPDTHQIVDRQDFIESRDYELDALLGRIILRHPLSQFVNNRGPSIIRSGALGGDEVFLMVDYEYVPDAFTADDLTYGARGKVWLNDYVAIGASKIVEQRSGNNFDLEGVDVTLKAGRGTYVSVEVVGSESTQIGANFTSSDGGLRFRVGSDSRSSGLVSGDAVAVEGRVNLKEVDEELNGDVKVWSKKKDAGFSSGRIGLDAETVEKGVDAAIQITDNTVVQATYAEVDRTNVANSEITRVQTNFRQGKFELGTEIRHENLTQAPQTTTNQQSGESEALLAGVRLGYDVNESQTVYGSVQTELEESDQSADNDLVVVGLNTQISEHTAVSIDVSDGDRGSALSGGFDYSPADDLSFNLNSGVGSGSTSQFSGNYRLAEGHELYGSYSVDPDHTFGERNLLTIGQRRDVGNRFELFTESQRSNDDRYASTSHAFGMDFKIDQDWVLSGMISVAEIEDDASPFDREALSIGTSVKRANYKLSSKIELRTDKGPDVNSFQYLGASNYTYIVDKNRRWLGKFNISSTVDKIGSKRDAQFIEFNVGYAYRPVAEDRWNLLTKYGYFYDLVSSGQIDPRPDQRVHILSTEALYRLDAHWEFGGKVAVKEGAIRAFRGNGEWYDYGVRLAIARARYNFTKQWDALAEYRHLRDSFSDTRREGALAAVYRHVGDHFKFGVGYNFTDFSDDIRDSNFDNRGWFLDLIGKF